MGIDCVLFQRLTALSRVIDAPERSLMLGRQGLHFQGRFGRFYKRALAANDYNPNARELIRDHGYADAMWDEFDFGHVESMDMSDFEAADHVHDLNVPVDPALHGKFDFIFDGGTIEHVFNVPQALANVFNMLKTGGTFVSANGMNGWYGHGLYQFNPDLVWSYWQRAAGCEVVQCVALPKDPNHPGVDMPDPANEGVRLRKLWQQLPRDQIYLYYQIKKTEGAALTGPAMQSDYQNRWDKAAEAAE